MMHAKLGSPAYKMAANQLAHAVAQRDREAALHDAAMYAQAYRLLTPAERKEYPLLYSQDVVKAQRAAVQWVHSHTSQKRTPTSSLGLMNKVGLTDAQRTAILKIFHRWYQGPPRQVAKAQRAAGEAYKFYTNATPDDADFKAVANAFAERKARAAYESSLWTSKMHAEINGTLTPRQRAKLAQLEHAKRSSHPR